MPLEKPLNKYIDHAMLKTEATHDEFEAFLDEAVKYQFASVCVSPYMAAPVASALVGEDINISTVVGFPLGTLPTELKLVEVAYFAERGVNEIDFVLNYGDVKSGLFEKVGKELELMDQVCRDHGMVSKCIVETCMLTAEEKTFVWKAISERTRIDYIKTSTGFNGPGASLPDVMHWNQLREEEDASQNSNIIQLTTPDGREAPLKIKAAGGIRDLDTALAFIGVGAERLGMSASAKVMEEWNARNSQTFIEGEETA